MQEEIEELEHENRLHRQQVLHSSSYASWTLSKEIPLENLHSVVESFSCLLTFASWLFDLMVCISQISAYRLKWATWFSFLIPEGIVFLGSILSLYLKAVYCLFMCYATVVSGYDWLEIWDYVAKFKLFLMIMLQEAMLKEELRNMERMEKREGVDLTYLKNVILKLLETGTLFSPCPPLSQSATLPLASPMFH